MARLPRTVLLALLLGGCVRAGFETNSSGGGGRIRINGTVVTITGVSSGVRSTSQLP